MECQDSGIPPARGLATEQALLEYLGQERFQMGSLGIRGPFEVQPIKGGATNFTYRIIFQSAEDLTKKGSHALLKGGTAVLKYAAEYATMTPDVPLTSDRQFFEAFAMQDLAPILYVHSEATLVRLPELLFHDQDHHVIVMEDVGNPLYDDDGTQLSRVASLEELCKSHATNLQEMHQLVEQTGEQLGKFVFGLHKLGLDHGCEKSRQLKDTFARNIAGRQLDVDTTFGEILDKVQVFGVDLRSNELRFLERVIHEMSDEMMNSTETIIMGDLWYGNVITKVSLSSNIQALESIHIIDWEFATCGPAFVDLAHFASEVWLQDRFGVTELPAFSANRRAAISMFNSYKASGGSIDRRKIVYYIGGHICCFLDYGNWTNDGMVKKNVAREGVDLILQAYAENWDAIKENKFLEELLAL